MANGYDYNELMKMRWAPSDNNVYGFAAPSGTQPASERDLLLAKYGGVAQLGGDFFSGLGYGGDVYERQSGGLENQGNAMPTAELAQWLQANGYQPADAPDDGFGGLLDSSGQLVSGSAFGNRTNDDATFIAGMLGLGAAGYAGGAFGGAGAGAGEAAGAAAATESAPVWNAALAESAAGTGGYGASSAGAGGGAAASWGSGAGYAADAATSGGGTMAGNGSTSLGDFFSGNGNWNDYLRAGQAAYGLYAQDKATDAATVGNQAQMAMMREMWQANQAENKPLVDMRNSVLPQISNLLQNPGSITQDPGYQFQLKQGQNALDNRAAASGNYYSGAQQKASQRYGQDYAGTKLDQSLNRLMGVATGTQVGSNQNQANNTGFAQAGGNALAQGGNIRAGGYLGQFNTVNNAGNNWLQDYYNQQAWGKP